MSEEFPWQHPGLKDWQIVGMNHYWMQGLGLRLFVSMTRDGRCIRAEGRDTREVWDELRARALMATFPRKFQLGFDPAKSDDEHIKEIFKDRSGGLVWCALSHCRLRGPEFNRIVRWYVDALRNYVTPFDLPMTHHYGKELCDAGGRAILGDGENCADWGRVIQIMVGKNQSITDQMYHFEAAR